MTSVEGDSSDKNIPAVLGVNDADGDGVVGRGHRGVAGYSASVPRVVGQRVPPGPAVYGESKGGPGVEGRSDTRQGVFGGSTSGRGVEGRSDTNYGVSGDSRTGAGVRGASDEGAGVEGRSIKGLGVYGLSEQGSAIFGVTRNDLGPAAVVGRHEGPYGRGGTGVRGEGYCGLEGVGEVGANLEGSMVGMFVDNSSAGGLIRVGAWIVSTGTALSAHAIGPDSSAAAFSGDVDIYGELTKSGGGFRIDHPADPANRYLTHSFVEAPTRTNLYDGTIVLDDSGTAEVELPSWFEELNTDFRYQLTAVGGPAPELHIARAVKGARFAIAGGRPGLTVCWQVTGTRQDPWARANPMPVESDKPAHEQGRYLHPELHGQPADLAVGRDPELERRLHEMRRESRAESE